MARKIDLNRDFYDPVSRRCDTAGLAINRAEVGRVLAEAGQYLAKLPGHEALQVMAAWAARGHAEATESGA